MHRYIVVMALMWWLLCPHTAEAYLDPGTGSLILQVVVAGLLSTLFFFKSAWRKIFGFFRRKKDGEKKDVDAP